LQCFCEQKEYHTIKVEGDVNADPLWCNQCGCNFDIEEIPITDDLKEELMKWAMMYGIWVDWSKDSLYPNGIALENDHNNLGKQLTEKVKKEIGTKYRVKFSPSSSARRYAGLKF